MVYGRYNLVDGDYFVVYKPTNITGGPHPVVMSSSQQPPATYPATLRKTHQ